MVEYHKIIHYFPNMENNDQLSAIFYALSDTRRRRMLEGLAEAPKTVGALAELTGMRISAASKNIAVLEEAGLLYKSRQGRATLCHMNFDIWRSVAGYVAIHAQFWAGRLDELAQHLDKVGDI